MKRITTAIIIPLLLLAGANLAVAEDQAPWYQVEVIIFAQADHYQSEENLPTVTLSYPQNSVFLGGDGERKPEGYGQLTPENRMLYDLLVPPSRLRHQPQQAFTPFAPLPGNQHLLNGEASRLQRSGDYQVLFHEAWLQNLTSKRSAPWVVISGGATTGEHRELEGSLRVYLSRFYHFEANLWRARFGAANDADREGSRAAVAWPELPVPPRRSGPQLPAFLAETLVTEAPLNEGSEPLLGNGIPGEHDLSVPNNEPWQVIDLDVIQQSIRIDDHSLHYLDHPRLGVLIQLHRYGEEETTP